ncbi:glycosyltransferase [Vibrio sp. 10N.286.51.F4]|uniref:glycosyltransferase n=1 Tax=Vibrio sp. 10N.286.51.F4 TaxID=3229710 RepID=UPI00355313F0
MFKKTDVVVIMCIYKGDDVGFSRDALDSLLKQSYRPDIYIYCDGVLPEYFAQFLDEYSSLSNIFIFKNKVNRGLAHGLNYLIDVALKNGYKFIARMDSDDISHPDRLLKQINYLNNEKYVDVVGSSCKEFGASYALDQKSLPTVHNDLLDFSISKCPFIHPTVVFRASVFESGIRYPTDTTLTEDMALWFKLLSSGYKFGNIDEVLLDYRLTEDTIERRAGIRKGISEFKVRFKNMILLNRISMKNIILIFSRLFFHILPLPLIKMAYRRCR